MLAYMSLPCSRYCCQFVACAVGNEDTSVQKVTLGFLPSMVNIELLRLVDTWMVVGRA
jgi:flagellar biosynthesis protein FliQ